MYISEQQETVVAIHNCLFLMSKEERKILLHQCTNISRKCISTQTAWVAQICNKNVYNSHFLQSHKIALEKNKSQKVQKAELKNLPALALCSYEPFLFNIRWRTQYLPSSIVPCCKKNKNKNHQTATSSMCIFSKRGRFLNLASELMLSYRFKSAFRNPFMGFWARRHQGAPVCPSDQMARDSHLRCFPLSCPRRGIHEQQSLFGAWKCGSS